MADSSYPIGHPLAVQKWSKELMQEALKRTYMLKFMTEGTNGLIGVKNELKDHGYQVTYGLRMQLQGDGVTGDDTLEGNEEALSLYADSVQINQLRHAVRTKGRASEQRVPFETRDEAKDGLADWWSARMDTVLFNHLAGINTEVRTAYTGFNTIAAPSTGRIIYGPGTETAETNLSDSSASRFSVSMIDTAVEIAKTASPMIRPIRYRGDDYYVAFLHPYQVKDLRTEVSTSRVTWFDAQKARIQGGQTGESENPIFSGALGVYNGVILHESTYVPLAPNTTAVRRAVFCGAQSGVVAFGKGAGPNRMTWVEEMFDFKNKLGVSAGMVFGAKKCQFNSTDFGTIVMSSGAA